jgi:hypothetical protein
MVHGNVSATQVLGQVGIALSTNVTRTDDAVKFHLACMMLLVCRCCAQCTCMPYTIVLHRHGLRFGWYIRAMLRVMNV